MVGVILELKKILLIVGRRYNLTREPDLKEFLEYTQETISILEKRK